jgi:outer membrane scaffolding protein for murein synthesis (MipA/OmpV family)
MKWIDPILVLYCSSIALSAQEAMGGDGELPKPGWAFRVGAVGLTIPSCPGADTRRNLLLPVLQAEYEGRYYFGSSRVSIGAGLGMNLVRNRTCTWSLGIGYSEPRNENRADVLAGMGNRSATFWTGSSFTYRLGPLSAGLTFSHGLESEVGNRLSLKVGYGFRFGSGWTAGLSATAGYADAKNMAYDFGVTEEQAAWRRELIVSGDPRLQPLEAIAYTPKGGLREIQAGLFLGYNPAPAWRIFLIVSGSKLQGDAALSPLVRKTETMTAGLGFAYTF